MILQSSLNDRTDRAEEWNRVAAQRKRPMSSVILDPGVIELVLEDAKDFLNSRKWYADRGARHPSIRPLSLGGTIR